ncbi:transcriptional activator protein RasR [Ralstonia solanacearum species complex bacterium KE056]|uniref:transcriptional activator protein RasR n=1 Tax=Ralstonia solanacearum species complex bacterium KE056 TaxID=3119585 RepID=UPI0001D93BB5|nr:transcriptional activator of quorum sensing autoinducer synthesis transcription regulator protein (LuxR family) [Ralstonia solanacearum CMR15]
MKNWQEDLLDIFSDEQVSTSDVFEHIEAAALALGFEHVAYGFKAPLPLSEPKVVLLNNYPQAWRVRYLEAGYLHVDPSVAQACRSQAPIVWSDRLFQDVPALWDEAKAHGLRVGWAQSSLDSLGVGGMLSLSRSCEPLSARELAENTRRMQWLAHMAHVALSRLLRADVAGYVDDSLTNREVEVMKWTADGKSAQDIADILAISKNTVDFHVKNAVKKLQAVNKTAAVVRAAMLGYLF